MTEIMDQDKSRDDIVPIDEKEQSVISNRLYRVLGRLPLALYIGGIPTLIGAGVEYATSRTFGVAIAGGTATILGTAFNHQSFNDSIELDESPTRVDAADVPPDQTTT